MSRILSKGRDLRQNLRQGFKIKGRDLRQLWKNHEGQIDKASLDMHAMIDRDDKYAVLSLSETYDFWGRDLREYS